MFVVSIEWRIVQNCFCPKQPHFFPLTEFCMPYSKSQRAEKISTETLAAETLEVIHEMLNIMVERIRIDNNDMGICIMCYLV